MAAFTKMLQWVLKSQSCSIVSPVLTVFTKFSASIVTMNNKAEVLKFLKWLPERLDAFVDLDSYLAL